MQTESKQSLTVVKPWSCAKQTILEKSLEGQAEDSRTEKLLFSTWSSS